MTLPPQTNTTNTRISPKRIYKLIGQTRFRWGATETRMIAAWQTPEDMANDTAPAGHDIFYPILHGHPAESLQLTVARLIIECNNIREIAIVIAQMQMREPAPGVHPAILWWPDVLGTRDEFLRP